LVQFAIIWHLTQTTNSATTLAIASMMGLLPSVLLSPFIGTWVDRGNRKKILIVADSTVALATFILAMLFAVEIVEVWHIYVALFIRAGTGLCLHLQRGNVGLPDCSDGRGSVRGRGWDSALVFGRGNFLHGDGDPGILLGGCNENGK